MLTKNPIRELVIDNLLKEYQAIAQSNPEHLRNAIPSQEIWRFFVDGVRQENGRKLNQSTFFFRSRLKSAKYLNSTFSDYIRRFENLNINDPLEKGQSKLILLLKENRWDLTQAELQNLTLKDILELDRAWLPFDKSEPNYLLALINSFHLIFDFSEELNVNYIKKLHGSALLDVKNTNYDKFAVNLSDFRNIKGINFKLLPSTGSVDGIYEILENDKSITVKINDVQIDFFANIFPSFRANNNNLKKYIEDLFGIVADKIESSPKLKDLMLAIANSKDNREVANYFYHLNNEPEVDIKYTAQDEFLEQKDNVIREYLETKMDQLVLIYNIVIKTAQTSLQKLAFIIEFIQECEHVHPFYDGNCRTFCMLLLNHELLRNGFPMAILSDPNKFDGLSKDELIDVVLEGMQNTFKLITEKKLYNIETQDVVNYLKLNPNLINELTRFDAVTQIEENNRNSCLPVPKKPKLNR